MLSRDGGLTYAEIARSLDISVKTVETQMGRALKSLRVSLKQYREQA
jgi:RNA polymerase sigma-70 factor (ECF subfamily)